MAQGPSQQDNCAKLAQTLVHPDACCQKGTMTSTKRKADELAPRDEQSNKAQHKEEQTIKNNLQTCFMDWSSVKKLMKSWIFLIVENLVVGVNLVLFLMTTTNEVLH